MVSWFTLSRCYSYSVHLMKIIILFVFVAAAKIEVMVVLILDVYYVLVHHGVSVLCIVSTGGLTITPYIAARVVYVYVFGCYVLIFKQE